MKAIQVADTDMEETRPMRLIDGRLVVWHPLDPGPGARQAEPVRVDQACSPRAEIERDDPDATRSMRLPLYPEGRASAAK